MSAPEGYRIESNPLVTQMRNLEKMYRDIGMGKYVGMLASGPPGIGKTYNARKHLGQRGIVVSFEKTMASNLTDCLRRNASANHRIVFDDTDTMFTVPTLNILKAAMDPSGSPRMIPDSRLKADGPFEFKGGIIFLTNVNPDNMNLKEDVMIHYRALLSRIELRMDLSFDVTHRYHYSCWLITEHARGEVERLGMSLSSINEVLDWFSYFAPLVQTSPRSLMKFMKIRKESASYWLDIAADSDEVGRLFQVKSAMHSNLIAATLPN